jgi:hypothetical protein
LQLLGAGRFVVIGNVLVEALGELSLEESAKEGLGFAPQTLSAL